MTRGGGREGSAFACWLRTVSVALGLLFATAALAQPVITSIDVRKTADGYVADVIMHVPVPRELAFAVLVDFEHMADWVPNLRESRVLKRDAHRATIEQQGVARFGALSLPFTTVREIEFASPESIHSTQVRGSMRRLESTTKLLAEGAGTRLDYHIEMVPGAVAAAVLTRNFLEHELGEQFEAVLAEMVRRKGAAAPAGR